MKFKYSNYFKNRRFIKYFNSMKQLNVCYKVMVGRKSALADERREIGNNQPKKELHK